MNQTSAANTTVLDSDQWNAVLEELRQDGFSPVEAIRITRAVLQVPLGTAKSIVHDSAVWDDLDDVERLHNSLEAVAVELGLPTT